MDARDRFLALVEELYGAAGSEEGWRQCFEHLRIAVTGSAELREALVPHIRHAVHLHQRIIEANRISAQSADALERLSHAVLLVDAAGRLRYSNGAGARLLALRDGLSIDQGELRASSASDTARLRLMLGDAHATSGGTSAPAGGVLAIGRPSGARSLIVSISRASERPGVFAGDQAPTAVVFVSDPDQAPDANPETLRSLFGLTPAESALAALLAQGRSLAEAAAQLGIARETARSRLKRIFEKTGTHRQTDLVRLLMNP
jgi:DNA-binding CsgD family transcriptional regulator